MLMDLGNLIVGTPTIIDPLPQVRVNGLGFREMRIYCWTQKAHRGMETYCLVCGWVGGDKSHAKTAKLGLLCLPFYHPGHPWPWEGKAEEVQCCSGRVFRPKVSSDWTGRRTCLGEPHLHIYGCRLCYELAQSCPGILMPPRLYRRKEC